MILVAIGGPSSSGKTTCARALAKLFHGSRIVHQDDFYKPDSEIPVVNGEQDWDCPEAIDFPKFRQYLHDLREGQVGEIKSLEPESDDALSPSQYAALSAKIPASCPQIVFVEGLMLFHDDMAKLFDISLFFYADYETLRSRRAARPGYVTAEGFWTDPPNYFRDFVWPAFVKTHGHLFEEPGKTLRDSVVRELGIEGFRSQDTTVYAMVEWAVDRISKVSQ